MLQMCAIPGLYIPKCIWARLYLQSVLSGRRTLCNQGSSSFTLQSQWPQRYSCSGLWTPSATSSGWYKLPPVLQSSVPPTPTPPTPSRWLHTGLDFIYCLILSEFFPIPQPFSGIFPDGVHPHTLGSGIMHPRPCYYLSAADIRPMTMSSPLVFLLW